MATTVAYWGYIGFRVWVYSPHQVDRIWGIRGSYVYSSIQKAIFYLLKGDCSSRPWQLEDPLI